MRDEKGRFLPGPDKDRGEPFPTGEWSKRNKFTTLQAQEQFQNLADRLGEKHSIVGMMLRRSMAFRVITAKQIIREGGDPSSVSYIRRERKGE